MFEGPENVDNNDCARMTSKNKNEKKKKKKKNQKMKTKKKKKRPRGRAKGVSNRIYTFSILRVHYILLQLQLPIQRRAVGY